MKTKNLLIIIFAFFAVSIVAQNLPVGMEKLTPEGVVVTVGDLRSVEKQKNMVVAGDKTSGYKAYFTASDATHGEELWVTDGTSAGTKLVKDIYPGPNSSDIGWMQRFNNKVVLQAQSSTDFGVELWISDGTEAGTFMVKDIHDFGSSSPAGFTQVNETQFIFVAKDFDSETYNPSGAQRWLWVSDGTSVGTKLIMECDSRFPGKNIASDAEQYFCRVGRKVFFKADNKDKNYGEELWVTDGTRAGTRMIKDINTERLNASSTADNALDHLTNFYNEKLFFKAFSIENANEPWMSDGTEAGTIMIKDTDPTFNDNNFPKSGDVFTARVYDGKVYFRGYSGATTGFELVSTDMTVGNVELVSDINKNPVPTGTAASFPDLFCEFDGVLFMKAQTGTDPAVVSPKNYGLELFYTDGTDAGTVMQSDLNPGIGSNQAWEGLVVSGSMYFRAQDATPAAGTAWDLFRMDNKDEFPVKVVDLANGNDVVHTLRNLNGDLIFTSKAVPSLFRYHYRKPNYDPLKDKEDMEINFKTRTEMTAVQKVNSDDKKLSIYPNPTKDYFRFDVPGKVTSMSVTDLTGKIIRFDTEIISNKKNISGMTKGTYIISVSTTEGIYKGRLVVN